jgi:hypothetical protein
MARDAKLPRGTVLKPNAPLVLDGDVYRQRGPRWPVVYSVDASRVSLDGSFRALNSWDGVECCGGDLSFPGGERIDGNYYVDIYDTSSKQQVLSLTGHFNNITADKLFGTSAWISSRYYLFPLNEEANRFVLCDMRRISSGHASNYK